MKKKRITFELPEALANKFLKRCKGDLIGMSALLRRLVVEYTNGK